jgi:hypothetical protein
LKDLWTAQLCVCRRALAFKVEAEVKVSVSVHRPSHGVTVSNIPRPKSLNARSPFPASDRPHQAAGFPAWLFGRSGPISSLIIHHKAAI